jgi:hypothetical protein
MEAQSLSAVVLSRQLIQATMPPHPITLSQSFSLYASGTVRVRVPILRLHPLAGGWVGVGGGWGDVPTGA